MCPMASFGTNKTFKNFLDSLPIGAVIVGVHGTIVTCDAKAAKILMVNPREAIGMSIASFFPTQAQTFRKYIEIEPSKVRRTRRKVFSRQIDDKAKQFIEITFADLKRDFGDSGVVLVLRDITKEVVNEHKRQKTEKQKKQLLKQVQAQRERLRTSISNIPGVVWEAEGVPGTLNFQMKFLSRYVEKMLGYSIRDLIVAPDAVMSIFDPEEFKRVAQEFDAAGISDRKRGITQFKIVKKNGKKIWTETHFSILPHKEPKKQTITGVTLDISKRKETENKLLQREKFQHALLGIQKNALEEIPLNKFFKTSLEKIQKALNADFSMILRLLPHREDLLLVEGLGWKKGHVGKTLISATKSTQAGFTVLSKEPIVVPDWEKEKRFDKNKLLTEHKVASGIDVGIPFNNDIYGIIGVHFKSKRSFNNDQIQFLQTIANTFGVVLDKYYHKEELAKSEEKYRNTIELAPDAIYALNKKGEFIELNPAFEKLTGFKRSDWLGISYIELTHPEDSMLAEEKFEEGIIGKASDPYELRLLTSSGKYIVAEFRSRPRIIDGKLEGKLGIFRDITERKHEELQRSYMLGIASHELKTPLASIKVYTQILQKQFLKEKNEKYLDYLSKIDQQINKLTKLISDLLDIERIKAGKLEVANDIFDFDEMVRETIKDMEATFTDHKIIVKGETDQYIRGDKGKISRVIINLLSNAVKYSPGKKKVIVGLEKNSKNVTISIRDFGVGISKENINKIFEPFYREQISLKIKIPSIGLGLYISSELVKVHGGKIWVESKLNHGSTFFISLPIKKAVETN